MPPPCSKRAEPSCHSEKTGKTYDAIVILDDTGGKFVNFKLDFPADKVTKGGKTHGK